MNDRELQKDEFPEQEFRAWFSKSHLIEPAYPSFWDSECARWAYSLRTAQVLALKERLNENSKKNL